MGRSWLDGLEMCMFCFFVLILILFFYEIGLLGWK